MTKHIVLIEILAILIFLTLCVCTQQSGTNIQTHISNPNNEQQLSSEVNVEISTLGETDLLSTNEPNTWFKAQLVIEEQQIRFDNTPNTIDEFDNTLYKYHVYACWDPVPNVQYYKVRFDFNDNPPEDYGWQCDYTDQEKSSCVKNPLYIQERYVFHLGDNPELKGYLGRFDTQSFAQGKHCYKLFSFQQSIFDIEGLKAMQVDSLLREIDEYISEYTNQWDIWVKGIEN